MCIRPSQWWNLMTLRRNVLGIMQKGYTLNGRTIRAAMVTVAKAKLNFSFRNKSRPSMRMPGRFRYSATLSRSGFTGKLYLLNHIVLYVENIDIVLAYTHAGACYRSPPALPE